MSEVEDIHRDELPPLAELSLLDRVRAPHDQLRTAVTTNVT